MTKPDVKKKSPHSKTARKPSSKKRAKIHSTRSKLPCREPQQERAKFTAAAILKAATEVIDEVGWANASTNRIAERAGVSIGSLYQYFDSKETILNILVERHINAVNDVVWTTAERFIRHPEESIPNAIRKLLKALLDLHKEDPVLTRVLTTEVPRYRAQKVYKGESEKYVGLLRGILEQRPDVQVHNIAAATHILINATESMCEWLAHDAPDFLDTNELIEEITAMLSGYVTHQYPKTPNG